MSDPPKIRPAQSGRKRSAARLAAVQALYQIELGGAPPAFVVNEFVHHRLGRDIEGENYGEADAALFADIVEGTLSRLDTLDPLIAAALTPEWPLERLDVVLRAVLRAGAYELAMRSDVPARVVISEYLEVAHAFFSGKEPGLVNGVLDRLAHGVRATELGEGRGSDG